MVSGLCNERHFKQDIHLLTFSYVLWKNRKTSSIWCMFSP